MHDATSHSTHSGSCYLAPGCHLLLPLAAFSRRKDKKCCSFFGLADSLVTGGRPLRHWNDDARNMIAPAVKNSHGWRTWLLRLPLRSPLDSGRRSRLPSFWISRCFAWPAGSAAAGS